MPAWPCIACIPARFCNCPRSCSVGKSNKASAELMCFFISFAQSTNLHKATPTAAAVRHSHPISGAQFQNPLTCHHYCILFFLLMLSGNGLLMLKRKIKIDRSSLVTSKRHTPFQTCMSEPSVQPYACAFVSAIIKPRNKRPCTVYVAGVGEFLQPTDCLCLKG
ncbi:hypothetical protein D917_06489 [Trichinella nativa]|uniref:Uncharacterized protein n=1 Tax=Trichinella nativa TaxID=6335 RepID=A0A1Y3EW67_9BILA|nr:hypothetical protein D917_06489 [Trichinella nativa]